MAILQTEMSFWFSCQEAKLSVFRITGRVGDSPQGVGHMHTLKQTHNTYEVIGISHVFRVIDFVGDSP